MIFQATITFGPVVPGTTAKNSPYVRAVSDVTTAKGTQKRVVMAFEAGIAKHGDDIAEGRTVTARVGQDGGVLVILGEPKSFQKPVEAEDAPTSAVAPATQDGLRAMLADMIEMARKDADDHTCGTGDWKAACDHLDELRSFARAAEGREISVSTDVDGDFSYDVEMGDVRIGSHLASADTGYIDDGILRISARSADRTAVVATALLAIA